MFTDVNIDIYNKTWQKFRKFQHNTNVFINVLQTYICIKI